MSFIISNNIYDFQSNLIPAQKVTVKGINGAKADLSNLEFLDYFGSFERKFERGVPLSQDALDTYVSFLEGKKEDIVILNLQMAQELSRWAASLESTDFLDEITEPLIIFFSKKENEAYFDESCIFDSSLFLEEFFMERLGSECFYGSEIRLKNEDFQRIFSQKDTDRLLDYFAYRCKSIQELEFDQSLLDNLPENCDMLCLVGNTSYSKGQKLAESLQPSAAAKYEIAEKCYQKAYRINPHDMNHILTLALVLLQYAEFLLRKGYTKDAEDKLQQSEALYRKACVKDPNEAEVFCGLAEVFLNYAFILDFTDRKAALSKLEEASNYAWTSVRKKGTQHNMRILCDVLITQAEYLQSLDGSEERILSNLTHVKVMSANIFKVDRQAYDNLDNYARAVKGHAKYLENVDPESSQAEYEIAERQLQKIQKNTFGTHGHFGITRDLVKVSLKRAEYLEQHDKVAALAKYQEVERLSRLVFALDTRNHSILPVWVKSLIKTGDQSGLAEKSINLLNRRIVELKKDGKDYAQLEKILKKCEEIQGIAKREAPLVLKAQRNAKRPLEMSSDEDLPSKKQKISDDWKSSLKEEGQTISKTLEDVEVLLRNDRTSKIVLEKLKEVMGNCHKIMQKNPKDNENIDHLARGFKGLALYFENNNADFSHDYNGQAEKFFFIILNSFKGSNSWFRILSDLSEVVLKQAEHFEKIGNKAAAEDKRKKLRYIEYLGSQF